MQDVRDRSSRVETAVLDFLNRPSLVATCAFGLAASILIFDGSLFRLWNMEHDRAEIESRIEGLQVAIQDKEKALRQTRKLDFLEAQARESLDLVKEGEMVFVFPDAPTETDAGLSSAQDRESQP